MASRASHKCYLSVGFASAAQRTFYHFPSRFLTSAAYLSPSLLLFYNLPILYTTVYPPFNSFLYSSLARRF